jgi:arylsulfatase A-like enzyme
MLTRRSVFGTMAGAAAAAARTGTRPNIIFILADDLGYGDLGCYNSSSKIPTPHLDRLAAAGIRFTDAHTPSAVCTPTRYGLLTGRYAWRTRLTSGVLDGFDPPLIEPDRLTVASLLKRQGYRTACIGKWHLGLQWVKKDGSPVGQRTEGGFRPGDDVDYQHPISGGPLSVGFDYYFGIAASLDMSPYCFIENDRTVGIPNVESSEDKSLFLNQVAGVKTAGFKLAHVMPALVEKATKFILDQARQPAPFFLYVPLSAPHLPIVPNEKFKGTSKAGNYGDFVVEVDDAVGSVMAALETAGAAQNTLIIFSSDNGGLWHWWNFAETDDVSSGRVTPRGQYVQDHGHASNGHWRGTKADIWEGGHRVPFLVRWPERVRGGAQCHQLICLTDFFATCADIAEAKLPDGAGPDSVSLLPVLLNPASKKPVRESLILHSLRGTFAVRHGEWKMIPARGSGGFSRPVTIAPAAGEPSGQLYNLRLDPAETKNLYRERSDMVRRLEKLLEDVRSNSGGNRRQANQSAASTI